MSDPWDPASVQGDLELAPSSCSVSMAPKSKAPPEPELEPDVDIGPPIQSYWSYDTGAPALQEFVAARPRADGDEGRATSTTLDAAQLLINDLKEGDMKSLIKCLDLADDFQAVCKKLRVPPHPAVVAGLGRLADTPTSLAIRGWACDAASLSILLALLSVSKVTQLRFWDCSLSANALELVASSLPPAVTILHMEGDVPAMLTGGDGTGSVADRATVALRLVAIPSLKVLSLRCMGLDATAARRIADSLQAGSKLVALSLWSNPIGDEGASAVLQAVHGSSTLKSLNLGRTKLTDAVVGAVERLLCAQSDGELPNETLSSLDLSYNRISAEGFSALRSVKESTLDLTGNPCWPLPGSEPTAEAPVEGK